MGCLPCFGSSGKGEPAKKGGARKDVPSDRRATGVGSGVILGRKAGSWAGLFFLEMVLNFPRFSQLMLTVPRFEWTRLRNLPISLVFGNLFNTYSMYWKLQIESNVM
uniref:Uncharacterized protein n=1 Tax=Aegilops tauschii subsp. strangulata TaxID=200361 RepID=A0A452YYX8_AEGTS